SDEAVRAVSSWVEKARLGQSYPLIVSEAGNDSMLIGSVISGEGCNVAFCPDSRVITERGVFSGSDFSIVKRTLCEILTLIKQRKVKA
ncbi:MAG TPA: hypothetical protein PLT66_03880, partial [Bacillota bacterium]|nr:hypothetical protein [Bacillota bacterium]